MSRSLTLRKALKQSNFPISTINDVLPELTGAKVMLRMTFGFFKLDEESSKPTTFSTPWVRYRWNRLSFGVSPPPEEFQRRLCFRRLAGCQGSSRWHNDMGWRSDCRYSWQGPWQKYAKFIQRWAGTGICLNREKLHYTCKTVPYIGHPVTKENLKADAMMITFLHLHQNYEIWLFHSEVLWLLTTCSYQCHASKDGLGAGLLEQGHSVAYVVRALNDTEQRYAKIEKDLLAVVFALEEFETSASGRRVVVESDHKEIVPIRKRALISAP